MHVYIYINTNIKTGAVAPVGGGDICERPFFKTTNYCVFLVFLKKNLRRDGGAAEERRVRAAQR